MPYFRRMATRLSQRDQHALLGLVSEAAATRGAQPFEQPTIESLLRLIPASHAGYFEYGNAAGCSTRNTFFVDEPAVRDPSDWACSDAVRTTIGSWPLRDDHPNVAGPPLKFSDLLTRAEMRRNPWYCEVMRPHGKEHELKVWLSAPAGTVRGLFFVRERRRPGLRRARPQRARDPPTPPRGHQSPLGATQATALPDAPRDRGARARGARPHEHRDRRPARGLTYDRPQPPREHLREARRAHSGPPQPRACETSRLSPDADRLTG